MTSHKYEPIDLENQTKEKTNKKWSEADKKAVGYLIAFVFFFLYMCIRTVPAGTLGVATVFGSVRDEPMEPGITFTNPFTSVTYMTTRTQMLPYQKDVLSSEGLTIGIMLSLQFHIDAERVIDVYKTVGPDYNDVITFPALSSVIREVTSKRDAKAMYTSQTRMAMHKELTEAVRNILHPKGLVVEDVLLRDVILPQKLKTAIESKLEMEQQSQRMKFVLQKEKQEAERKQIEATGIQKFQEIVSKGIDEQLLQWKGIEATLSLAESQNAKVVVVGNSQNGLPVIFDSNSNKK